MYQVDGIREHVGKLEEYLKKLVVWIRVLIVCVIAISLFGIVVYNYFAPPEKDISQQVINKLLGALNGPEFQAILATLNSTTGAQTSSTLVML